MGNTQAGQSNQKALQKYQFVQKISDQRNVYLNKQKKQQYISIQKTFATHEMVLEYERKMTKLLCIQHPYYLNQYQHIMITLSLVCSMQHKVIHLFQYQNHTLQQQLRVRQTHARHFQQKQIWSILCSCVLSMAHLTKNQIPHFNLHPRTILIDSLGMIKIMCSLLSQYSYLDVSLQQGMFPYYSPEELKGLGMRDGLELSNKSSVFSLGVMLLHILRLEPMDHLYDMVNFRINQKMLAEILDKVQQEEIKQILKKMLKIRTYQRITFTQLEEMLYNVLEENSQQAHSENQSNHHDSRSNQKDIQKLEDSIYRIHISQAQKNQVRQNNNNHYNDAQDKPNDIRNHLISLSDRLVVDQQDNNQTQGKGQHTNVLKYQQQGQVTALRELVSTNNKILVQKQKNSKKTIISQSKLTQQSSNTPTYIRQVLSRGTYQGYKIQNQRHGYGTFIYTDGGKYCGQWSHNKMQGRGALYYVNQQLAYEGQWYDDKINGYGVLYNQQPEYFGEGFDFGKLHLVENRWIKYQGNFVEDQRSGEGTLFLSNSQYYRGYFFNDLPHGNGIYKTLNGKVIKGNWVLGVLQSTN